MKKNLKDLITCFMIVGIIIGPASYFKTRADIEASKITFNKNNSEQYGTTKRNVQEAMDEIYDLAMAKQAANSPRYADGGIVYFNSVSNTKCTASDWNPTNATTYDGITQSKTGTKTGCMGWFAYLDEAGQDKVKLLLDHNTTATIAWYSSSTYKLLPYSNVYADLVDLVKTSGWLVQPTLIEANDVARITDSTWNGLSYFYFDNNGTSAPSIYSGTYW